MHRRLTHEHSARAAAVRHDVSRGLMIVLACFITSWFPLAAVAQSSVQDTQRLESKVLDRLKPVDRQALDAITGWKLPEIPESIKWYNTDDFEIDSLEGKVIVIQSWTNGHSAARRMPLKVHKILSDIEDEDLVLIALHTPADGTKLEAFLEKAEIPMPIMLDRKGTYCDALGIYRQPVNIVVDRNGMVRGGGIKATALPGVVKDLLAEEHDPDNEVRELPTEDPMDQVEFPEFKDRISSARDLRGRKAPDMWVDEWLTPAPNAHNKVVVLDFWATWCPPCRKAIPHMNTLSQKFSNDVCAVGISDERESNFEQGLRKHNLKERDFKYSLALDPNKRMKDFFQIRGIPHVVVISSDWIVRWQGHPMRLSESILNQIIVANKDLTSRGSRPGPTPRWNKG